MVEDKVDNLTDKAKEELEARSPKIESPLEEAKKVNVDNKKLLEEIKEERIKTEQAHADMLVAGKAEAGSVPKEETQDEKDQKVADEMIKSFK